MPGKNKSQGDVRYHLDPQGRFVIEGYNHSKPFCNFFPGVAGLWGIPMWVFYVNRGQGISSFGIESKDKAILEFQPANKAYRLTSLQGFRTFVKIQKKNGIVSWEPFRTSSPDSKDVRQTMSLTSYDLSIEEVHLSLGLKARVNYFTMPGENFPALVRSLTMENISGKTQTLEVLDGLPAINAFGLSDWITKNMSRTVEAWVQVGGLKNLTPYYHLNVEVSDTPDVRHITQGNFYFAIDPRRQKRLMPVVEPECVFGASTDFEIPENFFQGKKFHVPETQQTSNRTPCAMCFTRIHLPARKSSTMISLIGQTHSEHALQDIVKRCLKKGFIEAKALENRKIISRIENYALTNSASPEFNLYAGQTFLDNVLRGGLPVTFKTAQGDTAVNVFSRKHGDPERDYNHFVLSPTHYSQGNGNYRDVNQNRRNDVWFNQDVREQGIMDFLNLIQADGYNPLLVKGSSFTIQDQDKTDGILNQCVKGDTQGIRQKLQTDFQPGELLDFIGRNNIRLKVQAQEFLSRILGICRRHVLAEHVEGFWSDHWTYNLDLIERYLSLYPEDLRRLLLEKKIFTFFQSTHQILPRDQRYVLTPRGVRQYHSVKDHVAHHAHSGEPSGQKLKTAQGQGEVYQTTMIVKLLCLLANKTATLDPSGLGLEMEGGRPNWYDALNGLPGLLGSSLSETLELKRLSLFLKDAMVQLDLYHNSGIPMFFELAEFIRELRDILKQDKDPTAYWHRANDAKEQYRRQIEKGIDGHDQELTVKDIVEFLDLTIERADYALAHAKNSKGYLETYFRHDVTDYAQLKTATNGFPNVLPVKFRRHALPLFLEGYVHALRVERSPGRAREIYRQLKKSPLYDRELKMYKINSDLSSETEEIGRARIFPKGWLENESIWLHMEYKYLLELLKSGLHEEFYQDFQNVFIPFLKPEIYGRSTCENSSFIVSSAHEDATLHGRGFVARLSGSTAEFLNIWLVMNSGIKPFFLNPQGKVCLKFQPILPGWLFTKKETTCEYLDPHGQSVTLKLPSNTYAFNFLNSTWVVYHNPGRKNTFGANAAKIQKIGITYPHQKKPVIIDQAVIPHKHALDIRDNRVERIDLYLK